MRFTALVIAATFLFAGGIVLTQGSPEAMAVAAAGTGLSDPYQPAVRNWATLPDGRTWGSSAGIEVGPRGEIWAIDRCGANSCEGSNVPPIHLLDISTGKPLKSIGEGLFVFPHGLFVDRDGNIWVTDAQRNKDGTKGQRVIKLSRTARS